MTGKGTAMETTRTSGARWTDERLDALRLEMDPPADEVVATLLAAGTAPGSHGISGLFQALITHRGAIPPGAPPEVVDYFARTATLPDWADPARIEEGERLFCEFGPEMLMLLYYKALPECYACWRGAEVLYRTGQMTAHHGSTAGLERRLLETAQFVLDVMAPGGLSKGHGIQSIQKVRLIHAAIRHFIQKGSWDTQTYGAPINQEDLAGTLMAFSIALLDGLRTMKIHVTPEQEESYLHCWKVIGHLLGIRPELLPADVADGRALTAAILRRHTGPSEAGRALTQALVAFVEQRVRGRLFRGFPLYMIRYCTDGTIAAALDVRTRPSLAAGIVLVLLHEVAGVVDRLSDRSRLMARLFSRFAYALMQGMIVLYNHGKQVPFEVHPVLCENWELRT